MNLEVKEDTLPETNMAPENNPLEKVICYWKPSFLEAMLVSGSVLNKRCCVGGVL